MDMEEIRKKPLTPEYIVYLFETISFLDEPEHWEHNKKRLAEII